MAATLTQIRNGIKTALAEISGLTAYAIEPASPHYPAAWSIPQRCTYHNMYEGGATWTLGVTVMVQASEIGHAQTNLDPFLAEAGAKSVRAAIEVDPSLGGVVDSVKVNGITGYFAGEVAGGRTVGASFEVEIYA